MRSIPRRRDPSRPALSRARRAALLERRYQFFDTGRRRLALMLSVFVEHLLEHRILAPTIAVFRLHHDGSRAISRVAPSVFCQPWVDSRRSALFRHLCDQVVSASRRRESRRPNAPRKVQFSSAIARRRGEKRLGFTERSLFERRRTTLVWRLHVIRAYRTAALCGPRRRELAAADSRSRDRSRRDSIRQSTHSEPASRQTAESNCVLRGA